MDTTTPNRSMYPSRRSRGSNLTCVQDPADTTRPGAVLTGQDRVIFHPDRGNVHFRMRKGEGGEERNNGVSGMHNRTDRRTALREIALHASDGHTELCLCLSLSIVDRLPLSARPSFPGRVSGPRCPPSCPLTIVNRPPVPAYPAHPSLSVPPPSVRQAPDASRFRERPSGNACSRRTGRK